MRREQGKAISTWLSAALSGEVTAGVNFKDLTHNAGNVTAASRTVRLEYVRPL